jgi:hemoglobin
MSEPRTARIGVVVLAFALVAVVIVLAWRSRGDPAKGAEPENGSAKGGDQAKPPPARETRTQPALGEGSLHDRLGGRPGIRVLAGNLLDAVKNNEVIMANQNVQEAFPRLNVRVLHDHLTDFICKETGGPCEYTGGSIRDAVAPLKITAAEWEAAANDFAAVLTAMKVPEREAQELLAVLGALEDEIVTAE